MKFRYTRLVIRGYYSLPKYLYPRRCSIINNYWMRLSMISRYRVQGGNDLAFLQRFRWWKEKVSCLALKPLVSVLSSVTCQQVIDICSKLVIYASCRIVGSCGKSCWADAFNSYCITQGEDITQTNKSISNSLK